MEGALETNVRARVEGSKVEGVVVEDALRLGVPREEDGEAAVQEETVHDVGLESAADGVGGFEEEEIDARVREGAGGAQAGEAAANDDDVRLRGVGGRDDDGTRGGSGTTRSGKDVRGAERARGRRQLGATSRSRRSRGRARDGRDARAGEGERRGRGHNRVQATRKRGMRARGDARRALTSGRGGGAGARRADKDRVPRHPR